MSSVLTFVKKLFSNSEIVGFIAIALLLLSLPSPNYYQSLSLNPQPPQVRSSNISLPPLALYPINYSQTPPPPITAVAAIVIDSQSAAILFEKTSHTELLPASTTKIMTALIALESYDPNQIIIIERADQSIGQSMHLVKGEQISVANLLFGLLIASGNDAAYALASNFPGGYHAFVEEMNQKASQLNLTNTYFRNVSGVEQKGHYTTVRDLVLLAKEALKNPRFAQIVAIPQITVTSQDEVFVHHLNNTNQLLNQMEGIKGVKTGWTEQAGECLVTVVERNNHQIITAVLKSQNRFLDTQKLIDWTFAHHVWESD